MEKTDKEIKFKYYVTADARNDDPDKSENDIAFIEDKKVIVTHGVLFGELNNNLSVESIKTTALDVQDIITAQRDSESGEIVEIEAEGISINNTKTNRYISVDSNSIYIVDGLELIIITSRGITYGGGSIEWRELIEKISKL